MALPALVLRLAADTSNFASGIQGAAAAAQQAASVLKNMGQAAIDAANHLDPGPGAQKWNQTVQKLKDSFTLFEAQIGKQLRPVLEGVMETLTKVFAVLARIDWGELFKGFAAVGKTVWDGLVKLVQGIKGIFETVANAVSGVFGKLVEVVTGALGVLIDKLASAQDFIKEKLGVGSGGASLRMVAEGFKNVSENATKDFKIDLGAGFKEEFDFFDKLSAGHLGKFADSAKKALSTYGNTSNVTHTRSPEEILAAGKAAADRLKIEQEIAKLGQATADQQLQSALAKLALEREGAEYQAKVADDAYNRAKALRDQYQSAGNLSGMQAAQADMDKALAQLKTAQGAINQSNTSAIAAAKQVSDTYAQQAKAARELIQSHGSDYLKSLATAASTTARPEDKARAQVQVEIFQRELRNAEELAKKAEESAKKVEDLRDAAQKTRDSQSFELQKKHLDELERLRKQGEYVQNTFRGAALGSTGTAGSLASAGLTGFAEGGGPMGAVAAVATQLLTNSAGFKHVIESLNGVLQPVADLLGSVFEVLQPVLGMLQVITSTLSLLAPVLQALEVVALAPLIVIFGPVLAALALLAAVLSPVTGIVKMVGDVLKPFGDALDSLGKSLSFAALFQGVADYLGYFKVALQRMETAFNPMKMVTDAVTTLFREVFGGSFNKLANELGSLGAILGGAFKVALSQVVRGIEPVLAVLGGPLNDALSLVFSGIKLFAEGVLEVGKVAATVYNTILDAMALIHDATSQVESVLSNVASALGFDKISTSLRLASMADQTMADWLRSSGAQVSLKTFDDALNQVTAMTWQNADAQQHAAAAAQAVAESLSNVPSAYKIAVARDAALSGGGETIPGYGAVTPGPNNSYPSSGGGDVHIYGDVIVQGANYEDFVKKLKRDQYARTGSLSRQSGPRAPNLGRR